MNCFNCCASYDAAGHIPKILTKCGHSLCSQCLSLLSSNDSIRCPECAVDTLDIASLPTNTALLTYRQRRKPLADANTHSPGTCGKHSKPLEAYCEEDCALLCVMCVVEDQHTAHRLLSVASAAEKEREWVNATASQAARVEDSVAKLQRDVDTATAALKQAYDLAQKDVIALYRSLQDVLRNRQMQRLAGVTELYSREKEALALRRTQCQRQMELLTDMRASFTAACAQTSLELLRSSRLHRSMASHALSKCISNPSPFHFPALQKDAEVGLVCAALKGGKPAQQTKETRKGSKDWGRRAGSCGRFRGEDLKGVPVISISVDTLAKTEATMSTTREREAIFTFGGVGQYTIEKTDASSFSSTLVSSMTAVRASFCAVSISPCSFTLLGGDSGSSETSYPQLALSKPGALQLPAPRSGFGLAFLAGKYYLFGGDCQGTLCDSVDIWTEENRWSSVSKLSQRAADFAYCADKSLIYIAGGRGENSTLSAVECFNVDTGNWRSLPALRAARSCAALVLLGDYLFILGGRDGTDALKSVEKLSLSTGSCWTAATALSSPRHSLSAVSIDGCIVCLGGFSDSALDVIERLDAGQWRLVGHLASKRYKHASIAFTLTDT